MAIFEEKQPAVPWLVLLIAAVFLLCGIFPLVPGAGIFWCSYYLVSSQLDLSSSTGFTAAKIAIAIVLGIILAMELPQRLFSGRKKRQS